MYKPYSQSQSEHVEGPVALGDSSGFGWQNVQATAYRCLRGHESCVVPSAWNAYVVKILTSQNPVDLEWRHRKREKATWTQGTMSFMPIGEATKWSWSDPLESLFFAFPLDFWNRLAQESFGRDGAQIDLVPKFCPEDPTLKRLLSLLADEYYAGAPNGPLYAEGLALAATTHLLKHHSTHGAMRASGPSALPRWKLKRIEEYVDARIGENVSLADLAAEVDVALSYFPRVFRQATGVAPYQFVIRRRLARAMELMSNSELGLSEIALATGFSSQSHFTTAFRNLNGVTPNVFRRAQNSRRTEAFLS